MILLFCQEKLAGLRPNKNRWLWSHPALKMSSPAFIQTVYKTNITVKTKYIITNRIHKKKWIIEKTNQYMAYYDMSPLTTEVQGFCSTKFNCFQC